VDCVGLWEVVCGVFEKVVGVDIGEGLDDDAGLGVGEASFEGVWVGMVVGVAVGLVAVLGVKVALIVVAPSTF